jgi:hypothetical protein
MPAILATQEAEIRKIELQSQPGQIVHETLSQKYPTTTTKCWWNGSGDERGPKFKHQCHKKKKKKKEVLRYLNCLC